MRPEILIRQARALLDQWEITLTQSRVSRLVREYLHKVEPRGIEFEVFMRNAVIGAGELHVRRVAGQVLAPEDRGRGTSYNDQKTGDTATWNVFVERDLPNIA